MQSLKGLALFLTASALVFAQSPTTCGTQTIPICTPGTGNGDVQIRPQAVPTSTGVVAASDAYLKTITVTNTTSGALTFTLADRQASPIAVLSAVSIAANTTYVIVFPVPYWCPGGFTVAASSTGLVFYSAFRL